MKNGDCSFAMDENLGKEASDWASMVEEDLEEMAKEQEVSTPQEPGIEYGHGECVQNNTEHASHRAFFDNEDIHDRDVGDTANADLALNENADEYNDNVADVLWTNGSDMFQHHAYSTQAQDNVGGKEPGPGLLKHVIPWLQDPWDSENRLPFHIDEGAMSALLRQHSEYSGPTAAAWILFWSSVSVSKNRTSRSCNLSTLNNVICTVEEHASDDKESTSMKTPDLVDSDQESNGPNVETPPSEFLEPEPASKYNEMQDHHGSSQETGDYLICCNLINGDHYPKHLRLHDLDKNPRGYSDSSECCGSNQSPAVTLRRHEATDAETSTGTVLA